ncbi:hypothetical protein AAFF_G00381410 [Aldrovandia affinis]|uniref:Synaptopodin 2-like protein n=1 Tax=Aldrovandia affinis TaxID=143900 RepID=A0AAD7T7Y7_9TELE|nr:hypothetical protein AAFF_G00381410 [Aldrovandia affinis]
MPFSQPPAQATPFSPPPVQTMPFSQPPAQATPFSPPPVQTMPFSQPPAQATPFSPPPVQTMPFSPPPAQATPFSPPPVQTMPFSPPPAQATPFSPPPAQATPFSPPPVQTMPFSPPPTKVTPFSLPPVQTMPFSQPPAQATPFSPAPKSATPLSPTAAVYSLSQSSPAVFPPPQTPKVSFSPYVTVATTTPSPPAPATPTPAIMQYPTSATNSAEALASREQRISMPASRTGILQDARRRSTRKPMFAPTEEKKNNSPNPALLSMVQNLDERPRAGAEGFESGPEEDLLNLGAEACNFMQAQKIRGPPPVAPKPHAAPEGPQIPQMGGKGAELFARRQSRMDRYVVDRSAPTAPPALTVQPRLPSPTPSLPCHWKYSPNIRAPPPISYNPLLSPSCPPGAQRNRASEAARASKKSGAQKQTVKALDAMSRQPYQLNSAMFSYGGGTADQSSSLTAPKQIPIKAARVYNIKRFSTPTPMSAPVSLTPAIIAPRSATTLGEPVWHPNVASPPPAPTGALPELPRIYTAPIPNPVPIPAPFPTTGLAYAPLQSAKQWFKSAPELSPLPPTPLRSAMSGSSSAIRVPRPRFSASTMGIQANVWRPGSVHY